MEERNLQIEETADGSHTLYVPDLEEHYHSVNGAIQESKHVFISMGLHEMTKSDISILEVGFGTGLNALLTFIESELSSTKISYNTIEKYPLSLDLTSKLNYSELSSESNVIFDTIHKAAWNSFVEISSSFRINKINGDFTDLKCWEKDNEIFDLIYFDAFAPDKQPDLWTQDIFDYIYRLTSMNGVFVTYCAKGVVRRMLQKAGFIVERLPGPPGKREMLRGRKIKNTG